MKRIKSGGKFKPGAAEYADFFKSIGEIVKYLAALREKAAVKYEPIVSGIIASGTKDPVEIERALAGLLDHCGNPAVSRFFKKLCRYYYALDPVATSLYILFYFERWDPEGLKIIKKFKKK